MLNSISESNDAVVDLRGAPPSLNLVDDQALNLAASSPKTATTTRSSSGVFDSLTRPIDRKFLIDASEIKRGKLLGEG